MADYRNAGESREVALVVNRRARSGARAFRIAVRELERRGVRAKERLLAGDGREVVGAVRGAIERGTSTVVVGGGDGTLSTVVDLFANRPDLTLGLLPLGTGNEVARVLGIPLDVIGACGVIACGRVVSVDLAQASGDCFIHTALVDLPAHVNHAIPNWLKLRFGKLAYTYSLLAAIVRARPFRAKVTVGGKQWEGETVVVVVGNGRFHVPGSILLPRSEARKRGVVVYVPRDSHWMTLVRLAIGLWITRTRQPALLFSATADVARVETEPAQEIDLDGEFGQWTPVEFRLAREALRVMVPDVETL